MTIKATVQPSAISDAEQKQNQCPYCLTEPTKEHMQKLLEQYKPTILGYERIVTRMNKLTNKAKNRKITWREYSQQWKRLNRQLNLENPKRGIGFKLHPRVELDSITEGCQKCNYGSSFHIRIFSDLEPQPMQPKYEKIPKTKCPKCGMLGTSTKDKRGYVRFMHYQNGKRKVCYIGKAPK